MPARRRLSTEWFTVAVSPCETRAMTPREEHHVSPKQPCGKESVIKAILSLIIYKASTEPNTLIHLGSGTKRNGEFEV